MLKYTTPESAPRVAFQLDGRIMLKRPGFEIIQLTLKQGEIVQKHVNDFDVAIYILEGHGKIETSTESLPVFPGMLVEIDRGEERGITNTGHNSIKLLIIKLLQSN